MNKHFYQRVINESPTAYGLHRMICDENGIAIDYEFIEVNPAFEKHTGLKAENVLGKRITEVLPGIEKNGFDWIGFYGEIALNNRQKETEQFMEHLQRWYRVWAYSPEKYYFVSLFTDISEERVARQRAEKTLFLEITARKGMEQDFKQQTALLNGLIDSIPDRIFFKDTSGSYLGCNQVYASQVGKSKEDIIGLNDYDLYPRDVAEFFRMHDRVMLEQGKPLENEEHIDYPDGTRRFFNTLKAPLYSEKGQILGSLGVSRDITARKQAEEELLETRKYLENLLRHANAPIITWSPDFQITEFNQAFEKLTGRKRADVAGQHLEILFPDENRVESMQQIYRTIAGEKWDVQEIPILHISGKKHIVLWNSANIYNDEGHLIATIAQGQDITARKQAEVSLLQSEEMFSKAFHGNPIMMTLGTIEEGRYLDCNEAFCAVTAYHRDEVIGNTVRDINLFVDVEQREGYIRMLLERGKLERVPIDLRTKSGAIRSCDLWSQLIEIEGRPCHITGMVDITEQKRIEFAVQRLDRLNLVGEMAASIGHEIRNPMTTIRGFLQLLGSKEAYAHDQTYFDLMIEELDRAIDIITEYLNVAKDKKVDLQLQNLDEVVACLFPMIQADAIHQDKVIQMDLGEPPLVLFDAKEIRQLILNLVRNGLEAMSAKGILTIGTSTEGNEIVLFVKDQGHGLDPDLLDKLGTPFVTTKDNGIGLGLAVCYSIVARHKARIDYETDLEGTTFKVFFPLPETVSVMS